MIRHCTGSILDSDAQGLVNPVNLRGVMGKGLALAYRQRWPSIMAPYRRACSSGDLRMGTVLALGVDEDASQYVICLPTKDDWRDKSRLEDVLAGLRALVRKVQDLTLDSIAVPALGCGEGGLHWSTVQPVMEMTLMGLRCDVQIYGPLA